MTTPVTAPTVRDAVRTPCSPGTASRSSVINDTPGFVAQRVVATIVNVGCDIAQKRIAPPEASTGP